MARFSRLRQLLRARKDAAAGLPAPSNQPGEPTTSSTNGISPHSRAEDKAQPAATDHPDEPSAEDYGPWAEAFRDFETRQPELAADYLKHLNTFHAGGSSSSSSSSDTNRQQTKALSDTTSAAPLIQHLLADREKKQWRVPLLHRDVKIRAQVEKLTRFCLYTNDIVKQALSCQPHAALAWSAVSILLPLLAGGNVQHDAMLGGFEYIGTVQLYWRNHERHSLLPADADLRDALTKLYSRIVEYQAKVICHLSSAQLSRLWHNVTDTHDWEGGERGIAKLNDHCCRLVSEAQRADLQRRLDLQLAEMQESRALLSDIRRGLHDMEARQVGRHDDERESALLRDLASDYEHYKNVHPPRVPGTCEWLFNDEGFRRWRASTVSSLLWISAGPGCGKSVLARCLVDEGRLSVSGATDAVVCYFFFQTGVEGYMDACDAVAALLHQVFVQDQTGELIRRGLASHKNHGDKLRHNFAELWRILIACAASLPAGEMVCVLDALDECREESRGELLAALEIFFALGVHRSTLKFLITGRPYESLEASFRRHAMRSCYVHVDGDEKVKEINREINFVIDARMEDVAHGFSESHRRRLSDRLKAMENRTYLWLHLTLDIIKNRRASFSKASRIQELLGSLPNRVSDAYEAILNQTSDNPDDRAMTRALLELILASTRPLTLEEANHALTIALSTQDLSAHASIQDELWPRESFKTVIKSLSGLFINVCDSRLSFIHLTAREFLTDGKPHGDWQGRFRMDTSHATLTSSCMTYLVALDPGKLTGNFETLAQDFSFLAYSISNWPTHYSSQHKDGQQSLCDKARQLCDVSDGRGVRLVYLYCASQASSCAVISELSDCTELNLACALGLEAVVASLIADASTRTEAYAQVYARALALASDAGHAGVVQTLLASTDDKVVHETYDNIAFGIAVTNRHLDVTRVILDHSDAVHTVDEDVLLAAVSTGDKALVALLLDRLGQDIHFDELSLSGVVSNADHGAEVLELVLDRRGDDITITDALVQAAADNFRSATGVMALLLDRRGQQVNITADVVRAAASNYDCGRDLVTLLLKRRRIVVDENLLVLAAGNHGCGTELVEMLLEHGAATYASERVVNAMAANRRFGKEMLSLLDAKGLDKCDDFRMPITSTSFEVAARNIGCGRGVLEMLLGAASHVPITPGVVTNAVRNEYDGKAIVELLLERRWDEVRVTDEILAAASQNERAAKELQELLVKRGDAVWTL